ncbi:MAG: hypothetical protein LBT58_03755 [Endomicrobium sp.]|jgi:hypothetical protein|nr:hypothetical protein [Endomicrobium sp.]
MKKFLAMSILLSLAVCVFSVYASAKRKRHVKIAHVVYPANHYWDWGSDPIYWYPDPVDGDFYYSYASYNDYETKKNKTNAALSEIDLLEKRKAESEKAKKELAKIKITEAKFYKQYATDSPAVSMAEIILKNNSNYTVTAVFFRGKLTTPKSGKILIDGDFKCDLPEPLEPGSEKIYEIALNDFAGWAKVKVSDIAKFDVSIIGLGVSAGTVYVNAFSNNDQKKLDALKKKYID